MKHLVALFALGLALTVAGCSDDSGKQDAGRDTGVDKGHKDQKVLPDQKKIEDNTGEGCTPSSKTCKAGSPTCIIFDDKAQKGICSRKCTPDDPNTPLLNEDDCGVGRICASFRYSNDQVFNFCLLRCDPSLTQNPCPASSGQTCAPNSTQFSDFDQAVCWFAACKDNNDCPIQTATKCKNAADCASAGSGAVCTSGTCMLPGNCSPGGICGPHTSGKTGSKVGDGCKSDLDCPNNGFCLTEQDGYPNGYCVIRNCAAATLSEFACPTGSTCHRLFYGGFCHIACDQSDPNGCRGNPADKGGDYECYAWNNLTISGVQVSDAPVCAAVDNQGCDSIGTTLDCPTLGDQTNSTHMSCRDPKTGAILSNMRDPKGICLDDTASGPFGGGPDAGVDHGLPDVGLKDVGLPDAPKVDQGVKLDVGLPDAAKVDQGAKLDVGLPDAPKPDQGVPDAAAAN